MRAAAAATGAAAACMMASAAAQEGVPVIVPSQSSVYNQTSVNLHAPQTAYGQDAVRGADGVSCQSSVGAGGPMLDFGVIGSQDVYARDSTAVYGRLTVPLGGRPRRVDCTWLYELEIARMRMELDMMRRAGAMVPVPAMPEAPMSAPPAAKATPMSVATPKLASPPPGPRTPPVPRVKPLRAAPPQPVTVLAEAGPRKRGLR